jgi:hypothetical protein
VQKDDSAEDAGADDEGHQLANRRNIVDILEAVPLDHELTSGHHSRGNSEVAECLDFLQRHLVKFANFLVLV